MSRSTYQFLWALRCCPSRIPHSPPPTLRTCSGGPVYHRGIHPVPSASKKIAMPRTQTSLAIYYSIHQLAHSLTELHPNFSAPRCKIATSSLSTAHSLSLPTNGANKLWPSWAPLCASPAGPPLASPPSRFTCLSSSKRVEVEWRRSGTQKWPTSRREETRWLSPPPESYGLLIDVHLPETSL